MKKIWIVMLLAAVLLLSGCVNPQAAKKGNEGIANDTGDFAQLKSFENFADNVKITAVPNNSLVLANNYPSVNWRISYSLTSTGITQWTETYFLPGNTTVEEKQSIMNKESNDFKMFMHKCDWAGYRYANLTMNPPEKPSNSSGQNRTWSGSGRLPLGNATVLIYLDTENSRTETQKIGFKQANLQEVLKFEKKLEENKPGAPVKLSVWYRIRVANCSMCRHGGETIIGDTLLPEFAGTKDNWQTEGVEESEVFVRAVCSGLMNQSQLAYAQDELAGSSLVFY